MSIDRIAKLTEQYDRELELAEKHKKKAKAIAEQIKYIKGEECNDRINRLNLTPEQFNSVLRLLDDKTQLMDAVEACFPQAEKAERNVTAQENANTQENANAQEIPMTEDEREMEVPVFGEEGDEKVS